MVARINYAWVSKDFLRSLNSNLILIFLKFETVHLLWQTKIKKKYLTQKIKRIFFIELLLIEWDQDSNSVTLKTFVLKSSCNFENFFFQHIFDTKDFFCLKAKGLIKVPVAIDCQKRENT